MQPLPENLKNRRALASGDRVQCVNWNAKTGSWELDPFDNGVVCALFIRSGFGEVQWKRDASEVRLSDGWLPVSEGFAFLLEEAE